MKKLAKQFQRNRKVAGFCFTHAGSSKEQVFHHIRYSWPVERPANNGDNKEGQLFFKWTLDFAPQSSETRRGANPSAGF